MPLVIGLGGDDSWKDPLNLYGGKAPEIAKPAPAPSGQPPRSMFSSADRHDLVNTIIAEAAGEGDEGMADVASVIRNRSSERGISPGDVVRQRRQFTGYEAPGPDAVKAQRDPAVRARAEAALDGVFDGRLPDMTGGADHYHADSVKPDWAGSMQETTKRGRHIFYKSGKGGVPEVVYSADEARSGANDPFQAVLNPSTAPKQVDGGDSPLLLSKLQAGKPTSYIENMKPGLRAGLTAMFSDAPDFVKGGLDILSGARSPERQAQIIAENAGKYGLDRQAWLADVDRLGPVRAGQKWRAQFRESGMSKNIGAPGTSKHQTGEAGDLGWNGQEFSTAPKEVKDWVHANAGKYNLTFPMGHEPWHIETADARGGHAAESPATTPMAVSAAPALKAGENAITIDENYKPANGLGFNTGDDPFAALANQERQRVDAEQAQVADQFEQNRNRALTERHNATVDARQQQLEANAPGRYVQIDESELPDWQAKWEADNRSGGIAGDTGRILKSGTIGIGQSLSSLADTLFRKIPGGESFLQASDDIDRWAMGKTLDQRMTESQTRANASVTERQQDADAKNWWQTSKDGRVGTFGPAWRDPRSYLRTVGESAPSTVVTMLPGGILARGAYLRAIGAGLGERVAAASAARTATLAGAITEGTMGGADSARSVRQRISELPREQLVQSDAVKAMVQGGISENEAIKALTEDAASQAFLTAGVATGMFGGMGDRALAKIIAEGVGGGIIKRIVGGAVRGFVGEGLLEEAPQGAAQTIAENAAVQKADPNQSLTEGVGEAVASGIAAGGAMGAGLGSVGGAVRPASPETSEAGGSAAAPVAAPEVNPQPRGPLGRAVEHAGQQIQERVANAAAAAPVAPAPMVAADSPANDSRPQQGATVRVEAEGIEPFMARVDGYEGDEAVVIDSGSGEIYQVPIGNITQIAKSPQEINRESPIETGPVPINDEIPALSNDPALEPQAPIAGETTSEPLPARKDTQAATERLRGKPQPGQRVIVDDKHGGRFAAKVDSYEEGQTEALVTNDDGEVLQVPVASLFVDKLTKKQVEAQDLARNPPIERERADAGPNSRRVFDKTVVMPDDDHAALYDLAKSRFIAKKAGGAAHTDLERVGADEVARLADKFKVSKVALMSMADDYRYRVDRAAKEARSQLPQKMPPVNDTRLRKWQSDRAKEEAPGAVQDGDGDTQPNFADWWDLTLDDIARKKVLVEAGIKRSDRAKWGGFTPAIRKKLEVYHQPETPKTSPADVTPIPAPETRVGDVVEIKRKSQDKYEAANTQDYADPVAAIRRDFGELPGLEAYKHMLSGDRRPVNDAATVEVTHSRKRNIGGATTAIKLAKRDGRSVAAVTFDIEGARPTDGGVIAGLDQAPINVTNIHVNATEDQRAVADALVASIGKEFPNRDVVIAQRPGVSVEQYLEERFPAQVTGAKSQAQATIDEAAHEAATSPENDRPEPTHAQKEAGNYKLGHVKLGGLDISIENPAGSERNGGDPNGKPWSVEMKSHYGYIKGTVGKDKDHVDVFVKPGTEALDDSSVVYVVDQKKGNGHFDEHKAMLGFSGEREARSAYMDNYSAGWDGLRTISTTTLGEFKDWLKSGNADQPFAARNLRDDRFPDISSMKSISFGPGARVHPKAIEPGAALYRETSTNGLEYLLLHDDIADVANFFVANRPELALGQGLNKGVHVAFRPDALSGREHQKPGLAAADGKEFTVDMVAPRSVAVVTMPAKEVKKLRARVRQILSNEFTRRDIDGGLVTFTREGIDHSVFEEALGFAEDMPRITKPAPETMEPIEVYHGTLADFERFDPKFLGTETGAPSAKQAFFFSSDARVSAGYAKGYNPYKEGFLAKVLPGPMADWYQRINEALLRLLRVNSVIEPDGQILRTRLRLSNPLIIDAKGKELRDRERTAAIEKARSEGYDAVVFRNSRDAGYTDESDIPSDVYAVLDAGSIDILSKHKSAHEATAARNSLTGFAEDTGPFGPILRGYEGNWKEAALELERRQEGDAIGALSHPDIGPIDLVWGKAGSNRSNGFGLAKLIAWHPEVLRDLQGTLERMRIVSRSENRIQLEDEGNSKAGVRLDWDGATKHWLISAFLVDQRRDERSTDRLVDIWKDASSSPPPTGTIANAATEVDAEQQKGPRGFSEERAPDPIIRGSLNDMRDVDPPHGSPSREWAKASVVSAGKETGHEYIAAIDGDGALVSYGTAGRSNYTGLNDRLLAALANRTRAIDVYHNHPQSGPLSAADIGMLAMPGLRSVAAFGHDGTDTVAQLTQSAKEQYPGTGRLSDIGDLTAMLRQVQQAVKPLLDRAVTLGTITPDAANAAYFAAPGLAARDAGIITLQTSVDFDPASIPGLEAELAKAVSQLKEDFANGRESVRAARVRGSAGALAEPRNVADLGERNQRVASDQLGEGGLSEGSARGDQTEEWSAIERELAPARATSSNVVTAIGDALSGKFTDVQPHLLATVPLNYFPEISRGRIPAIDDYLLVKRKMDAYRGVKHDEAVKVIDQWRNLISKGFVGTDKARAAQLADMMHAATLAGIDPSVTTDEEKAKAGYDALRKQYLALPPNAREVFNTVRDAYSRQADETDELLLDNVRKAQEIALNQAEQRYRAKLDDIASQKLSPPQRRRAEEDAASEYKAETTKGRWAAKARMTRLRQQFESNRVPSPYFPLGRFGRYFTVAKDIDGKVLHFGRHESKADMDNAVKALKRELPNAQIGNGVLEEGGEARKAMDPRVVAEIETLLANSGVSDDIRDALYQRYLATMPDLSMRKRFIHRKGTPGYNRDAFRVFASTMFHGAHQMARLKYGLELQENVNQAVDQAQAQEDNTRDMTLVNELIKRDKWVRNPTGAAFTNWLTSIAYVWYMGLSPAAALVNASQTVMLGVPLLGAKFGVGKASKALLAASKDFALGKGDVRRSGLSKDERAAMNAFYDSGLIDRTQSHDLAAVGETGTKYNPIRSKAMNIVSWGFHNVEVMNREITALAAYRLARDAGQSHLDAINTAHERTYAVHFDMSNSSRPRVMQSDFAKTALMFRSYQINMLYRLFRDAHQSLKGETPAVRREARMQLAGATGMMALLAGATGTVGYGFLMTAASLMAGIFGDDDDPMEIEDQFKAGVINTLGPELGGIVLNGLPGHYLGIDLTSRIGMPDLWFRSPNQDLQGREEWQYWVLNSLGASVSLGGDMFEGFKVMTDEKSVARGLETMAPKAVRDLMKTWRYSWEGVRSRNGDEVLPRDEVGVADVIKQALGFTPAIVRETYDRNSALRNAEKKITDDRRRVMNAFAKAVEDKDDDARNAALDEVRRFNANPANRPVAITSDGLKQSLKARARNRAKKVDGVLIQNEKLGRSLRNELPKAVYR